MTNQRNIESQRWRVENRLRESAVVRSIAVSDASEMWQMPGFVHLLGACLYRLEDANFPLLKGLGATADTVRRWAADNLLSDGLRQAEGQKYTGSVRFEYEIQLKTHGVNVSRIRRPIRQAPARSNKITPIRSSEHGSHFLHSDNRDSAGRHVRSVMFLVDHLDLIEKAVGPHIATETTLRYIILSLLDFDEVQDCLKGLGLSVDDWETKLAPPQDNARYPETGGESYRAGGFGVEISIGDLESRQWVDLSATVDAEASMTSIPGYRLRGVGIAPESAINFRMADGNSKLMDVGHARIRVNGCEGVVLVAFSNDDAAPLLGRLALSALFLEVDPEGQKLAPWPSIPL